MSHKQIVNPYLPLNVCIPDGEPHVFGDRVYLFGSHDEMGGKDFCLLPYEVWSAPVDDLTSWSTPGVSYRAEQDPGFSPENHSMYAPDVVQGNDGRFYLYYCLGGYTSPISVAVCDTPDGQYRFLGTVRNPDGSVYRRYLNFDPAVINDGGVIRLYHGAWFPFEDGRTAENSDMLDGLMSQMFGRTPQELHAGDGVMGPMTLTLLHDMLTVASEPKRLMPVKVRGTAWEAHPFFEASSIRKLGDTYYFIYSSWLSHELCYATSKRPDEGFTFRGILVSNGDIGLNGRAPEDRLNYTGNTHGSIECVGGQWYVFYHRQTHATEYSRQGCAEHISIAPDGSIAQAEMTSCGLNGGALEAAGSYPAAICCNLTNGHMPHSSDIRNKAPNAADFPQLRWERDALCVCDIADGTQLGYKYFRFDGPVTVGVSGWGPAEGKLLVSDRLDGAKLGEIAVTAGEDEREWSANIPFPAGVHALFLRFAGTGRLNLKNIFFQGENE